MDLISEFVEEFRARAGQYASVKELLESDCKRKLEALKIEYLWQSRVKAADSLEKKLRDRQHRRNEYPTDADNVKDIKDLIGVRIILVHWSEFAIVENMVKENFDLIDQTQHPKPESVTLQQRFRGHDAHHFYVTSQTFLDLRAENPSKKRRGEQVVSEVQVMSVWKWAWAALQHDIEYKDHHGEQPKSVYSGLQALSGIANVAEEVSRLTEDLLEPSELKQRDASQELPDKIGERIFENKGKVLKEVDNRKRNKIIISWLSTIEVEQDHNQVRATLGWHYKDSGKWFQKIYDEWLSSENLTFWLVGSAGTGKSTLISHIIEWHFKSIQPKERERLAFFYCSRKKGDKATPLEVLRTLIAQPALSASGSFVAESIQRQYEERGKRPIEIEECPVLLADLVKQYKQTTFIIDALDECENPYSLLLYIQQLWKSLEETGSCIKFVVSSRYQVIFPQNFPHNKLELEGQKDLTIEDMKRFISTQVKDRVELRLGSRLLYGSCPELEDRLIKTLVANAQGMFIWAKLQLESFLGPKSRIRHQRDVIAKLHKLEMRNGGLANEMLDEIYEEIFDNNTEIESPSRELAVRAYKWMIGTKQPLTIAILAEATSFETDGTKDTVTEDSILDICSNFVIKDLSGIAQFAHASVQEYLERRRSDDAAEYSLELADIQIALTCIACLNHSVVSISDIRDLRDSLLGYSSIYWPEHSAAVLPENLPITLQHVYNTFISGHKERSPLMCWTRTLHKVEILLRKHRSFLKKVKIDDWACQNLRHAIAEPPDPLFVACKQNRDGSTCLILASYYGHQALAQQLLEKGADINGTDGWGRTALYFAVGDYGNKETVQLLLEKGADINGTDRHGRTALYAAIGKFGSKETVLQLLENGAAINARNNKGNTTLHEAVRCFVDKTAVQLLLENGAKIEAKNSKQRTALNLAAYSGNDVAIVQLLKNRADTEAKDSKGRTALHQAVLYGDSAKLKLLLEYGVDVEAKDNKGRTALHYAALSGDKVGVKLLLESRAEFSARNIHGQTVLCLAVRCGSEATVQLLLENGADIIVRDNQGRTVLDFAMKRPPEFSGRAGHSAVDSGEGRLRFGRQQQNFGRHMRP